MIPSYVSMFIPFLFMFLHVSCLVLACMSFGIISFVFSLARFNFVCVLALVLGSA